jgi:hypothetical protein
MKAFAIAGRLGFHFDRDPRLPDLLKKLYRAEVPTPIAGSVRIVTSGVSGELRDCRWRFYKGVPYRVSVRRDANREISEIFFQAPIFRQFLFFRIVLLPLLWRQAVRHGGFYLLGTVYREEDRVTVLFARPGAGKTRRMLVCLQEERAKLIGDGSLIYMPGSGFMSIIDELELRRNTIAGLPFKKRLTLRQRLVLWIYHMISMVTARYISLNISILPESLGISSIADPGYLEYRIAEALPGDNERILDKVEIEEGIMAYLEDYIRHYRNIFDDVPPFDETRKNISAFIRTHLDDGEKTAANS